MEEWIIAPFMRIAFLILWFATPMVNRTFHGGWVLPLLGVLFLPLTALTFVLVTMLVGGVNGWNWLWVAGALLIDLTVNSAPARRNREHRRNQKHKNSAPARAQEVKD